MVAGLSGLREELILIGPDRLGSFLAFLRNEDRGAVRFDFTLRYAKTTRFRAS